MASSSSSSPRTWRYRVFTSFHGPDVRKTFLSHLRKQFACNGISMFNDQAIERSHTIAPALTQAIRESRISIVVLTKNYASSSWCLDELLEILKCKEEMGQIVMTIFYGVDPSHVRKQTGDFGKVLKKTCSGKTEEEKQRWSQALTDVGNIAGEHFLNWDKESEMIEKIARDVSNKLNATVSRDFEDMVGIEAHLDKMQSLLHSDEDGAMIVGICGPAGIGKTTIARALHSRLSSGFQLTCFMENLRGSCNSGGLDEYGLKLRLQELLLSKIFNQNGMRIYHLGAIPERLCDLKVLIILDDVDDLQQLEALADETNWFGDGSRIIVTTEDQELLEQHGITNIYHVDLPTEKEARKIFCRYAFRQSLPPYGYENLAERATELCGNLPFGLRVMGSMLRGKKEDDWESILCRLENSNIPKIEAVLRVGYDSLHEKDQILFHLIAVFFNYENDGHVKTMLADSGLDVRLGLKTLAYKSLIKISSEGEVVMHKLLQQVGRQAIQRQEPWKRQILIDTDDIRDVLENDSGSRSLMGISFDMSTIKDDMDISARVFKSMRTLRFLRVYNTRCDTNVRVHLPEDMEFPPRLKLLHWEVYPRKCLPRTFCPEHLVELHLTDTQLEQLWEGTQPLTSLKKMVLVSCLCLKELPDLANATNLEILDVCGCQSLVEIHSSVGNLHRLQSLDMIFCKKLQVVPTLFNLTSLESLVIMGSYQMRELPDISTTIRELSIPETMLEEFLESTRLWSHLQCLEIFGCAITHQFMAHPSQRNLMVMRSVTGIERIPDCIKCLHGLKELSIYGCPKLASLPELPRSLTTLTVYKCPSLETLEPFPFGARIEDLSFLDCFRLGRKARRLITQQSSRVCLPGRNVPAEFHHRAIGNFVAICSNAYRFKICAVISPKQVMVEDQVIELLCHILINGCPMKSTLKNKFDVEITIQLEHLIIFPSTLLTVDRRPEQYSEILFEFSTTSQDIEVIECGVQILRDKTGSCESNSEQLLELELEDDLDYDAPRVDTIKDFAKDKESEMIEKIARDVSNKLNSTVSTDFEDMVGIEAHLEKMQSLLHLDDEGGAMFVGICGPAGIGKTTIARALHSRLSSGFQHSCFMENLRGSCCNSGLDEYGLKLRLQELLLSKIFNQNGMRIYHLGAIPERLCDQKVLIILDDVDDLKQLEALADETKWFGDGSRVIIFCRIAFRQLSAPHGFEKLVERVVNLCSNLPLGLRVMGSSLRRKKVDDWEAILQRLENSLNRDIEGVLRVGYDNLHKDDQFLFQLIACFFNYQDDDRVKAMLVDSNLDVRLGLKTLSYKSLIQISAEGTIVMHKLLQQVGREAVHLQEPRKRQILIDAHQICDVLENDYDSASVMGISFDTSTIPNGVCISAQAFRTMRDLRFLSIYETRRDPNVRMHLPEDMSFPPLLRLLHWEVYPGKCLPHTLRPEHLVELCFVNSKLEQLWQGIQPLTNLKKMDLSGSLSLKEVPDLSNATHLKRLNLTGCWSLVEIPSSIGDLHKLEELEINLCISLQVFPSHLNLASLETLEMAYFLYFPNCFKLCLEAKRVITQQSFRAYFPGKEMPAEFDDHRSFGSSLTIRPAVCKFRICLVLSPKPDMEEAYFRLLFCIRVKGCPSDEDMLWLDLPKIRGEHLFIFQAEFVEHHEEMVFKFSTSSHEVDVAECGVQVLTDESCSEQVSEDGDDVLSDDKSNGCDEPRIVLTSSNFTRLKFCSSWIHAYSCRLHGDFATNALVVSSFLLIENPILLVIRNRETVLDHLIPSVKRQHMI
uniref:ADP-ribosyl cyclase/cyclic ADP-ribose hydrolase n=1 Tax=Brassica campestris TaxID=3711 RepID=M4EFU7_BRACM